MSPRRPARRPLARATSCPSSAPARRAVVTVERRERRLGRRGARSRGPGIHLSYHWLDLRGNPIVWAGRFIPLPSRRARRAVRRSPFPVAGADPARPLPPRARPRRRGPSMVLGARQPPLEHDVDVRPRLQRAGPRRRRSRDGPRRARREPRGGARRAGGAGRRGRGGGDGLPRRRLPPRTGLERAGSSTRTPRASRPSAGSVEVERRPARARGAGASSSPGSPASAARRAGRCRCSARRRSEALEARRWPTRSPACPRSSPASSTEPWLCDGRIRVAVAARALQRADRRSA